MPRLLAFWLRVLGCYGQAMILMIICWTLIVYFNQEYRSPSYQQSFSKCLRWASWIAPVNGGGPFVPVFFSPIAPDDSGFWLFPWEGLGKENLCKKRKLQDFFAGTKCSALGLS